MKACTCPDFIHDYFMGLLQMYPTHQQQLHSWPEKAKVRRGRRNTCDRSPALVMGQDFTASL